MSDKVESDLADSLRGDEDDDEVDEFDGDDTGAEESDTQQDDVDQFADPLSLLDPNANLDALLNRPGDRASTWATETLVRMDGAIIGPAGDYVSVVVDYVVYEIPLQNGVVGPKDFWVPLLQVPVTCQVTFGEDGLISAIYDHFDVRGIFMQIRQVTQRIHIRHPLRGGIIPAGGIPEGPRGSAQLTSPPPTQPVMLPRYAASSTSLGQMRSNPGTLGLSSSSQVGVNTPDAGDNLVLGGDRLTSGSLNSGSSICADAPLDSLHNKSPSIGGLTPAPGPPTVGHFS
eukprot:gene6948-8890_t